MLCNRVGACVDAKPAHLVAQVAKMTQRDAAQPGDVLRAFTCTNFVFPTNSLFGAKPPVRLILSAQCHLTIHRLGQL